MALRVRDLLPGAPPAPPPPRQERPGAEADWFLGDPVTIGGVPSQYYPIGVMAAALNRSQNTIREWERARIIPPAMILNRDSINGRRRLYTGAQIRGLRQLAGECGALDNLRYPVKDSEFSQLAFVLFAHLDRDQP